MNAVAPIAGDGEPERVLQFPDLLLRQIGEPGVSGETQNMNEASVTDDMDMRRLEGHGKWVMPGLFAAEALAVGILLMAYRVEAKGDWKEFLNSRPGLVCAGATLALVMVLGIVAHQCHAGWKCGSKQWVFGLILNAIVVIGILAFAETALRLMSVASNTEERIVNRLLYPRRWEATAANFRAILKRAESRAPFWIADEELGWTIGPSRRSADGLYLSSPEGLRATTVEESFQGASPGCRIAFLGDSFTFGEEVAYEDAWVHHLAKEVGPRCQVLNFAVGGYGVDQMYLRYLRDVRPWKPDVVVLAFVNHDVVRTLSIYSFLLFPGGETPFAKPRFVLRDNQLVQLNRPLISPDKLFAASSIQELPFIEYDGEYKQTEWDRPVWRPFYHSYLFRLLISIYPLHERDRPVVSPQVLVDLNTEIFRAFRSAVVESGAESLVVYLPSVDEIPDRLPWVPIGQRILREGQIPHVDIRDCMADRFASDFFMPPGQGQHYSPIGNRAAAACLSGSIRPLVARILGRSS